MFTGIVEALGTVTSVQPWEGGRRLALRAPSIVAGMEVGASVSVDGACLTAVEILEDGFRVEVVGTTLSRTLVGAYEVGSRVNLERAVRVGDRLDGHLVQGHVDGTGTVEAVTERGDHHLLDVALPGEVARTTILHGSITFNGVSLTVNRLLGGDVCQVAIIPHTWEITNLSLLGPGDSVNVEGDLIGKYVGRWMAATHGERP